ncbi:MAG TPA: nuclear transport factor 2 family protein [Rhizomicrobium sp.]|jgi:hypothetical protein|nr:nuclear transport factor 2 family protein [Rhizomicrobium sp.]
MPNRDVVDGFVALVESGDYVGALERYYAEDASIQENNEPPRVGRDVLVASERMVMAGFKSIAAKRAGPVLIDGDQVAIRWSFVFERQDGATFTLDEIAWQRWHGGRIAEEKFFYDPKQMGH